MGTAQCWWLWKVLGTLRELLVLLVVMKRSGRHHRRCEYCRQWEVMESFEALENIGALSSVSGLYCAESWYEVRQEPFIGWQYTFVVLSFTK